MTETPQRIRFDVYRAVARGQAAWREGAFDDAEAAFLDAWHTLPEPRLANDYAQSLARGLVVFYRHTHQFDKARAWLRTAREAFGAADHPSVQFLAGTLAFDAGALDDAFVHFEALYQKHQTRPFEGEDPKYLAFYQSRAGR